MMYITYPVHVTAARIDQAPCEPLECVVQN